MEFWSFFGEDVEMDINRKQGLGLTLLIRQLSNELILAILVCVTQKTAGQIKEKYSPYDFTATSLTELDYLYLEEKKAAMLVLNDGEKEENETRSSDEDDDWRRSKSEQVINRDDSRLDRLESKPDLDGLIDD